MKLKHPQEAIQLPVVSYTYFGIRLPIILMTIYFWWVIWTPAIRFPFLGAIYFEKLLALTWFASVVAQDWKPKVASAITYLILSLYFWLVFLTFITPVEATAHLKLWMGQYWKKIFFFVMGVFCIRDRRDLFHALSGLAAAVMLYQLLSWRDFLSGGSYVYQQGLKRMTGTWVKPSYGAGNFWGSLSAFCVPIVIYVYHRVEHKLIRIAMLFSFPVLALSVLYSGSRGALVTLILYLGYYYRAALLKPKYILLLVVAAVIAVPFVPPEYKKRYSMIFVSKGDVHEGTRTEQIAKESAASRLQGLVDGWNIMLKYPLGCGPEQSGVVRLQVNSQLAMEGQLLKLHNLYGQVLGEGGFLGTILVGFLWLRVFLATKTSDPPGPLDREKDAVRGMFIVSLVYGMGAHSLYAEQWIWIYLFAVVINNIESSALEKNTNRLKSTEYAED